MCVCFIFENVILEKPIIGMDVFMESLKFTYSSITFIDDS